MKIKLEFERDDFRKMIQQYFQTTGWEVLNLDDIVDQFDTAFPGGIIVRAEISAGAAVPSPEPAVPASDTADTEVAEEPEEPSEQVDGNPRLQYSQLTGPQDEDDSNEISHILRQSASLKRT